MRREKLEMSKVRGLLIFFAVFIAGSALWAQTVLDGLEFEIVDGKSVTIKRYTGNAGAVNISERIQGLPVTAIGFGAFSFCDNLTSITIPSSVTSIGNRAFGACKSLTNINVDRLNPAYASIDGVLFDKTLQTLVTYPPGRQGAYTVPASVTTIGKLAFLDCRSLTSVSIPSSVTSIGEEAFYTCNRLPSIIIPSSVRFIGDEAFFGCHSLTSITIPSSVTSIGEDAFSYCASLTDITVGSQNPAYASIDGVLFDKTIRTIIAYPAGKDSKTYAIPSSVTFIGDRAFGYCNSLTSITIPPSVTSIGSGGFGACKKLASIAIPPSVTSIGESAFSGCESLTSIVIPPLVTVIEDYTFYRCHSLTDITIPSSVTSIRLMAFSLCTSLTSIIIPSSVTFINYSAFWGCDSLVSVTLSRHTQVGENAFPDSVRITYRD
jgi:hypothetical protein